MISICEFVSNFSFSVNKYLFFISEFKLEKSMLQDRCRNLQTTNQDFNKRAEELSKKMSVS